VVEQVYRGPDRRRRPSASRQQVPTWVVAATLAGAAGGAALLALLAGAVAPDGLRPLADTLSIVATALFFGAGVLRYARWQVTGEAYVAANSAALVVFAVVTFPMTMAARSIAAPGALGSLARLVAAVTVAAILIPALGGVPVDSRLRPRRLAGVGVVVAVVAFVVLTTVLETVDVNLVTSTVASTRLDLAAAAIWLGLAGVCLRAGARRRSLSATWSGAAIALLGVAGAVRWLTGDGGAWSSLVAVAVLTLLAAVVSVTNAGADARAALSGEGNQLLQTSGALADAERLLSGIEARREELVHDARSMISALQAASTTLDRHAGHLDEADSHRLRAAMAVELGRLGRLIEDSTAVPVIPFGVRDVVGPVVATLREQGLEVEWEPDDVRALGRPDDLAQALRNLLVNAAVHAPGSPVALRVRSADGMVNLLVEDRGPGIPAELADRVFDRGVRAGPGRGSGLGLHVARRLMRVQGGDLQVAGRPGGGTSFVISLPGGSELAGEPVEQLLQVGQPGEPGYDLDAVDVNASGRVRLTGELDHDASAGRGLGVLVDDGQVDQDAWLLLTGEVDEREAATGQGDC
jgi:two-component system, OmpR family, sensor kinase